MTKWNAHTLTHHCISKISISEISHASLRTGGFLQKTWPSIMMLAACLGATFGPDIYKLLDYTRWSGQCHCSSSSFIFVVGLSLLCKLQEGRNFVSHRTVPAPSSCSISNYYCFRAVPWSIYIFLTYWETWKLKQGYFTQNWMPSKLSCKQKGNLSVICGKIVLSRLGSLYKQKCGPNQNPCWKPSWN